MNRPDTWKRLGDVAKQILPEIEQLSKGKDDDDTSKQPELGSDGDRVDDIRQQEPGEA